MRRDNEEGNKAFWWNNEWESQMPPTYPQLKKGIYVLNIIVQGIMEKNICEGKGSQGNTQNVNAPNRATKTKWRWKP
jgi:hypothetical protein